MNKENLPVEIRKTYLRPYVERIYCKKCGAELKAQRENEDISKILVSLLELDNSKYEYHYHCDNCGTDYCSMDKYPKTGYEEK